jgi:hypothetical protein
MACTSESDEWPSITGPLAEFTDASGVPMDEVLRDTLTMSVSVDWADVQLAGLPEDVLTTEVVALAETASCRLDADGNIDTCLAKFSGRLSSASGWWDFEVNNDLVGWSAARVEFAFTERVPLSEGAAQVPFVYASTAEPDPSTKAYVGVDLVL